MRYPWILFLLNRPCPSLLPHEAWEMYSLWNTTVYHSVMHVEAIRNHSSDRLLVYDVVSGGMELMGSSFDVLVLPSGEPYYELHIFSNNATNEVCFKYFDGISGKFASLHIGDAVNFMVDFEKDDFGDTGFGLGMPTLGRMRTIHTFTFIEAPTWCDFCTTNLVMNNPLCIGTCNMSVIDSVIQLFQSVVYAQQNSFFPHDQSVKIKTCIAALEEPTDLLTSNDIITYIKSNVLNSLPVGRSCVS